MNYEELKKLRNKISNDYIKHYKKRGFIVNEPLPLSNESDLTLDFTTCTICEAKPNISKGIIDTDYVTIQPSMRNNMSSRKTIYSCVLD